MLLLHTLSMGEYCVHYISFVDNLITMHSKWYLTAEEQEEVLSVRDDLFGNPEQMTDEPPVKDSNGELKGGTKFECSGIKGIKGAQCYSTKLTHQHSQALVGVTASAKTYENTATPTQEVTHQLVKVGCKPQARCKTLTTFGQSATMVAAQAMELCAPEGFIEVVKAHAQYNNITTIGFERNIGTPAVQFNIAPAVAYKESKSKRK